VSGYLFGDHARHGTVFSNDDTAETRTIGNKADNSFILLLITRK
jgi:hypothetical protein